MIKKKILSFLAALVFSASLVGAQMQDVPTFKTDDNISQSAFQFELDGGSGVVTSSECVVCSIPRLIISLASTGNGAAWVQGGNSFGALGVFGTNDSFDVSFRTNGTERMRLSATNPRLAIGPSIFLEQILNLSGPINTGEPKIRYFATGGTPDPRRWDVGLEIGGQGTTWSIKPVDIDGVVSIEAQNGVNIVSIFTSTGEIEAVGTGANTLFEGTTHNLGTSGVTTTLNVGASGSGTDANDAILEIEAGGDSITGASNHFRMLNGGTEALEIRTGPFGIAFFEFVGILDFRDVSAPTVSIGNISAGGDFTMRGDVHNFGTAGIATTMTVGQGAAAAENSTLQVQAGATGTPTLNLRRDGTNVARLQFDGVETILTYTGLMQFLNGSVRVEFDAAGSVTAVGPTHNWGTNNVATTFSVGQGGAGAVDSTVNINAAVTGSPFLQWLQDGTERASITAISSATVFQTTGPLLIETVGGTDLAQVNNDGDLSVFGDVHTFGVAGTATILAVGQGTTGTDNATIQVVSGNSGTTLSRLRIVRGGLVNADFVSNGTNVDLNVVANLPLRFFTNNTERMQIAAGGRVTKNGHGVVEAQTFSSASDTAISTACATETQVFSQSITTTSGLTAVHELYARVDNGAGASRNYEYRLRRGGTGCSDATLVDNADSYAEVSDVTSGDEISITATWSESSPGGAATYRVCACTSNTTGTQNNEWTRLTTKEF